MRSKRHAAAALLAFAGWASLGAPAQAAFLQWTKVEVTTRSERQCLSFASDVLRNKGLQNIRVTPFEAAGSKGGVYVSITCVGRGSSQRAITVVMAMSDNNGAAVAMRNDVAGTLKGMVRFDR